MGEEIRAAKERGDTTVPLSMLNSFYRELRGVLKAAEGVLTAQNAPQTAERRCNHVPSDSGACRCPGVTCGSPICTVCQTCHKVKLGSASMGTPAVPGAPPPKAVDAEERFSGGHFGFVGGEMDGTTAPVGGSPPVGAKVAFAGEVYVLDKDGHFHYSADETMKSHGLTAAVEKPKLIIPGK